VLQQQREEVKQPKRDWEGEIALLREENERLRREIERLRGELDSATRATKRQAAPFSRRARPSQVDEVKAAPLPARCSCGGCVQWDRTAAQYQEDIECRTVTRRFDVAIGRCLACRKRVQGRRPEQTSDALAAAAVQIGPRTMALAAVMTKQMGLSLDNARQMLEQGCGLTVNRSTLSQALSRMADKAEPTYEDLLNRARQSVVNAMDETGWRVGGWAHWTHVAVGEQATVYKIRAVRDGWAPYRKVEQAFHQTCLAHLLRRCRELEQQAGQDGVPRAVKQVLQQGLKLRDRHGCGEVGEAGLAIADRLEHIFTFLRCPGLAATNHEAERALCGLVIARKVWGGNRTVWGARTQLMSVLRTCRQQRQAALPHLMRQMGARALAPGSI
jgi:transposase